MQFAKVLKLTFLAILILVASAFYLLNQPNPQSIGRASESSIATQSKNEAISQATLKSTQNQKNRAHAIRTASTPPAPHDLLSNPPLLLQKLLPTQLISQDTRPVSDEAVWRRSLVETASNLGKILFIEEIEGENTTGYYAYSAERLVIAARDIQSGVSEDSIAKLGLYKPYAFSEFYFLDINADTPADIDQWYNRTKAILIGEAVVELDGIQVNSAMPTDPRYGSQWHHGIISSEAAWNITQGTTSILVGVLDSGINAFLPEFAGRLVGGYDFVNNDFDPADDDGHGTWVTAVIAANANNGVHGTGVDWNCRIMPLKIFNEEGVGFVTDVAAATDFGTVSGVRVLNYSGGGPGYSFTMESAVNRAIANGVVFVTSTGNDNSLVEYPGRLTQTIAVGATNINDFVTFFSNFGTQIDLVAPGEDIVTTNQTGGISTVSGTSFSTPLVAATAALMLSINPNLNQTSIESMLRQSADDQVGGSLDTPGFDIYYGHGRLNVDRAVRMALDSFLTNTASVYRFFNTSNGAHFFTANAAERENVLNDPGLSSVWVEEGVPFRVLAGNDFGSSPVYRFFNTVNGIHFYTISIGERDFLLDNLADTYVLEGVGFFAQPTNVPGTIPVYRFFNTVVGNHFLTVVEAERDNIIQNLSHIYNFEGVAFFAYPLSSN